MPEENQEQKRDSESFNAIVDTVRDYIKSVDNGWDKIELAERLLFEIAVWSTDNIYEALGLFEKVKTDYIHEFYNVMSENEDDLDDEYEGEIPN